MKEHEITRKIEIDAGHRVTFHGSKCRNLHGHRYTIEATCKGPLFEEGEQQGMVLDFGFLKEEMVEVIDKCCDHAMILWVDDPFARLFIHERNFQEVKMRVTDVGWARHNNERGAFYIMSTVPTAENLARHWFERLEEPIRLRSDKMATLVNLRVWETPNCWSDYPGIV